MRWSFGERGTRRSSLRAAPAGSKLLHRDFVLLLLVQMTTGYAVATFFLLPKFMVEQLGASPSQIGLVSAGFGLAGVCSMPVVGPMLDRGWERSAVVTGSALLAASALLFNWVVSAGAFSFALRFVQGLSVAMVVNGGSIIVTRSAPEARLAEAIGLFAAANLTMNAVAPMAAELLAERFGYGATFSLASISAAGSLALALSLAKRPTAIPEDRGGMLALLAGSYLRMAVILLAVGMGYGVMLTFSSPFALSLGDRTVRGFFVAFSCAAVAVRTTLGRAIDVIGHRRVSRAFLLLYGVAVAAMAALPSLPLPAVGALFGLAHGVFIPAFTALMIRHCRSDQRGRMLSLFNASFGLGHAAVVGLGPLVERYGYRRLFFVCGAIICFAPLLLFERHKLQRGGGLPKQASCDLCTERAAPLESRAG